MTKSGLVFTSTTWITLTRRRINEQTHNPTAKTEPEFLLQQEKHKATLSSVSSLEAALCGNDFTTAMNSDTLAC